jgi:hypothetical protein
MVNMEVYILDPLRDGRWGDLVASHPQASVFHHQGWLRALATTYGYRPVVFTTTPPKNPLWDGLVFCEVESWITGRRLVSLPFADHANPLLNPQGGGLKLQEGVRAECRARKWKYVEIRPLCQTTQLAPPLVEGRSFWFHTLSLAPALDQIFKGFHKDCIQRRIHHAQCEHLSYERGDSEALVSAFYRLLIATRKRHCLLPQPRAWFRNLVACMSPRAEIRLLRKDGIPIAAIFTLRHRRTVVYKYGCSDARFHHLGGMPLLFWNMIVESKAEGGEQIDFGRTDLDNEGLVRFKDRFGTSRSELKYFRYSEMRLKSDVVARYADASKKLFPALPEALSSMIGSLVYRHIA